MTSPRRGTTWRGPAYQDKRPLHIESSPGSHRSLCTLSRLSLIVTDESRSMCKRCEQMKRLANSKETPHEAP